MTTPRPHLPAQIESKPFPTANRTVLPVACVLLALAAGGCGYNARDAFMDQRGAAITAREGDGSTIAAAPEPWPTARDMRSVRADAGIGPIE